MQSCQVRMEAHHLSMNRLLLSLSSVTLSVLFTFCCCLFRSLMGQSTLLCDPDLLQPGLPLVRGLMGQSHMPREAHLLQPGLSLSPSLIALSSGPRSSPAKQQTAKHDELYPFFSVSLFLIPPVFRPHQLFSPTNL